MDDLKKRILSYLESDRARLAKHFDKRCRERLTTRADAQRVLRNGTLDRRRSEGANLAFIGTDTRERRTCVIVRIDEIKDFLVLVSVFPLVKGKDEERH
jgi:hypothetical protein